MALFWAELSSEEDRRRRAEFEARARDFWSGLSNESPTRDARLAFAPRVTWTKEGRLCWDERAARPEADLIHRLRPSDRGAALGKLRIGFEEAAAQVRRESNVDLKSSRVRVGLTRGHLFELTVSVPLDVSASVDELQWAAESLFESWIGEEILDDWVACISIARIARTKGLLVVSDSSAATNYPLSQTWELLERGISGISTEIAAHSGAFRDAPWTALDIPPADVGDQADRVFASTTVPEALKAALEGMPFSSRRFVSSGEIFVWLGYDVSDLQPPERLARKEARERRLNDALATSGGLVTGSGFGRRSDYVDVCTSADVESMQRLVAAARESGTRARLGFYDSIWADETIELS